MAILTRTAGDCIRAMQAGTDMIKIRSVTRHYKRTFVLDQEMSSLTWKPSTKKAEKAFIKISDIREVFKGQTTDIFRQLVKEDYSEDCSFSIIYGDKYESLDLVASSPDEANVWITGLRCLISNRKRSEKFDFQAVRGSGFLMEEQVMGLVKQMSPHINLEQILSKHKECSAADGTMNRAQFLNFFKEITTRPEVYFILVRYANIGDFLTVDDLMAFLESEQGVSKLSKEDCLGLVKKYEPTRRGRREGFLGIDGFIKYLLEQELFDSKHLNVCEDMDQPLSHYFIASSHNTDLLEDQLTGPSSVEAYKSALLSGCRCVEMDCWDGPNNEPVIYHGQSLTTKITFKSVIQAINEYAFVASEYPVILWIQNHCSTKQQRIIAHYLKEILGDKLCNHFINENQKLLTSPRRLRRKIILKGKKLPVDCKEMEGFVSDEECSGHAPENGEKKKAKKDNANQNKKQVKLIKQLSDLINLKCITFNGFQEAKENNRNYYETSSFEEVSALKLNQASPDEFVNFNKNYLSRIYPATKRVDSSNYNPQDLWNCGCQLVAMNYQTRGEMMDLHTGKFTENGGCGYVLKPPALREDYSYFNPSSKESIPGVDPQILHIRIISGQNLPKPRGSGSKVNVVDPYVILQINGIPIDCAEERSKTIANNGFNPVFDESYEFLINLPELAILRFLVKDDEHIGDDFIGQFSIPLTCVKLGYRHLKLYDDTGELIPLATLFIHVAMTGKRAFGSYKRGMSIRKLKKTREYAQLKTVGIKSIDEIFKEAVKPLRTSTDLRDNVQIAIAQFKEICGLAPSSNIKQCIKYLTSRLTGSSQTFSLSITSNEGERELLISYSCDVIIGMYEILIEFALMQYPHLEAIGGVPEGYKKSISTFQSMIDEGRILLDSAPSLQERLEQLISDAVNLQGELVSYISKESGVKNKKLLKVKDNYGWNMAMMRGQVRLLIEAYNEFQVYVQEIHDVGKNSNIAKPV
ncbi:Inactive phospholipase C-like protein 2 [Trichoplax sp. H2]|nr:Inactive phospholipase C-like protein 2 [Trichoplax sp. H2]|eukprot:RDD39766.1 Inactive phospholipase C-like protein 2 [Trichoplax sp. H2]